VPYKDPVIARQKAAEGARRRRAQNPDLYRSKRALDTKRHAVKRNADAPRRQRLFALFSKAHLHGNERAIARMKLVEFRADAKIQSKLGLSLEDYNRALARVDTAMQKALSGTDAWTKICQQCGRQFVLANSVRSKRVRFCSKDCFAESIRTIDQDLVIELYRRNLSLQKVAAALGCNLSRVREILIENNEPLRKRTNAIICCEPGCTELAIKVLNKANGRWSGTRCPRHKWERAKLVRLGAIPKTPQLEVSNG